RRKDLQETSERTPFVEACEQRNDGKYVAAPCQTKLLKQYPGNVCGAGSAEDLRCRCTGSPGPPPSFSQECLERSHNRKAPFAKSFKIFRKFRIFQCLLPNFLAQLELDLYMHCAYLSMRFGSWRMDSFVGPRRIQRHPFRGV